LGKNLDFIPSLLDKMILNFFSALLAISTITLVNASSGGYSGENALLKTSIREKLAGPPTGWAKDVSVKLDKSLTMSLRIHLVHQDMDKFHELALNVCNSYS
jgi:tripeptidyl-peptidase I